MFSITSSNKKHRIPPPDSGHNRTVKFRALPTRTKNSVLRAYKSDRKFAPEDPSTHTVHAPANWRATNYANVARESDQIINNLIAAPDTLAQ